MAVRQYIGARYTIKIYENSGDPSSAEWQSGVTYEPLVLVTYNNSSYLSKKLVSSSVGNPASNPSYWVCTGYYNGQISQLQNDVANLQNDTSALQALVGDLVEVSRKNLLVIGNSYTNKGVANQLGATFNNWYKKTTDGGGFSTYTGHAITFEDLLDDAILDANINNDDITDVLFVSAWGDSRAIAQYGESTYSNTLNTTSASIKNKIATHFPNCKRISVTLAEARDQVYFSDDPYSAVFKIHRLFKESFFAEDGIQYLGWSGFSLMFISSKFMSDRQHPTAAGAEIIGAWLKGSYYGNQDYRKITDRKNVSLGYSATSTANVLVQFTPDEFNLEVRQISATLSEAVTLVNGGTLLDLTTFDKPMPGPSYYDVDLGVKIYTRGGSDQDWLFCTLSEDSNGIAKIVTNIAPTAATVSGSNLLIPILNNLTYR